MNKIIAASVFDQFEVKQLINLQVGEKLDLSLTNTGLYLLISLIIYGYLYWASGVREGRIVPTRVQTGLEMLYDGVKSMSRDNIGPKGDKYFPFIFALIMLILTVNMMGLIPYSFAPTSQIATAFGLSLSIWIGVTLLGIVLHGLNYFSMFMPAGSPLVLAPFMVILEAISHLAKAVSLGVRLAANITAGHILFVILAGFIWQMIEVGGVFLLVSLIPFAIMAVVTVIEIGVAAIQAYVFSLLTAIYTGESEQLH